MVIAVLSAIVTAMLGAFFMPILREEFQARAGHWAENVVLWAVMRLPESRRDRYFEEWLAYIDAGRTPVGRFLLSMGVVFAAAKWRAAALERSDVKPLAFEAAVRGVDFIFAIVALIIFAPMMTAIAIAVRVTSPGPVLFKQVRVGKNGRYFSCYKFRTMQVDAADRLLQYLADNPAQAELFERGMPLGNDPRITAFGRFMRKSSLDELPQLLNLLNGSMSIVGPRPITPIETRLWRRRITSYTAVKPGITGLWQISAKRRWSYRQRLAMDHLFVRKRGWKLILAIIVMTIPAVLRAEGPAKDRKRRKPRDE